MNAVVKKTSKYEQFYMMKKAKKYRNLAIQAGPEDQPSLSDRSNEKLIQENSMYEKKNHAYFQLIEVL